VVKRPQGALQIWGIIWYGRRSTTTLQYRVGRLIPPLPDLASPLMLFRGVGGPGRGSPPMRPRPRRSEIMALAGYRTGSARPMCSPSRLGRPVRQLSCFVRHANGRLDRLTGRGGAAARTSLRDGRTTTIRAPDRAANPLYSPGLVRNESPSRTSAVQLRERSPGSRRAGTSGAGRATTELRWERVTLHVMTRSAVVRSGSRMAAPTGRGRGFAVHKGRIRWGVRRSAAADGCGRRDRVLWPGLALLAVPGALTGRVEAQRRQPCGGHSAPVAGAKPAASCP
jgi:hypothetical protein